MRTYWTGHPSPAVQVARRVGTNAGGYTLGTETADGARLFCARVASQPLPVLRAVAASPKPAPIRVAPTPPPFSDAPQAMRLLAVLEELAPSGVLPSFTELARRINPEVTSATAASITHQRLLSLQRRGLIRWWRGIEHERAGLHAVRIVASGKVLRSRECPEGVEP